GGSADAVVARTVRWGAGWSGGGGGLETAGQMFERVRAAWREAGREGKPELRALSYFALGPEAETGRDYLVDYYGASGERLWPSIPREPAAIAEVVRRYEEIGTDELTFSPTIGSIEQVD